MYLYNMGILIIEENSVYEVDEECLKTHKIPDNCILSRDVLEYLDKNDAIGAEPVKKFDLE